MKSIKLKQTLIIGLTAMILVAGYYRWSTQDMPDIPVMSDTIPVDAGDAIEVTGNDTGFFGQSRQERDSARSLIMEMAQAVIDNEESTADAKRDAQSKLSETTALIQRESTAETLIKAKGYQDCVVLNDENGDVSVVVEADELDGAKVNQIKDIVVSQLNVGATQIKISNYDK